MSDVTERGRPHASTTARHPSPDVQPPERVAFADAGAGTPCPTASSSLAYDIPGQYVISVRTVLPFPLSVEPRAGRGRRDDHGPAPRRGHRRAHARGVRRAVGAQGNRAWAPRSPTAGSASTSTSPKRRLAEALDLLRQALAEPVFPEPEVRPPPQDPARRDRAGARPRRRSGRRRSSSPPTSTRPTGPPGPRPGTTESIARPDPPGHRRLPRRARRPDRHDVGGGAATSPASTSSTLAEATLGTWVNASHVPAPAATAPPARRDAARVVLVDRPGSVQSELLVGWAGPDRHADDGWAAYPVLGFMVGRLPERARRRGAARGEGLHLRHPLGLPAPPGRAGSSSPPARCAPTRPSSRCGSCSTCSASRPRGVQPRGGARRRRLHQQDRARPLRHRRRRRRRGRHHGPRRPHHRLHHPDPRGDAPTSTVSSSPRPTASGCRGSGPSWWSATRARMPRACVRWASATSASSPPERRRPARVVRRCASGAGVGAEPLEDLRRAAGRWWRAALPPHGPSLPASEVNRPPASVTMGTRAAMS